MAATKQFLREEDNAPIYLICDTCHQPIERVGEGWLEWLDDIELTASV